MTQVTQAAAAWICVIRRVSYLPSHSGGMSWIVLLGPLWVFPLF